MTSCNSKGRGGHNRFKRDRRRREARRAKDTIRSARKNFGKVKPQGGRLKG